MLNAMDASLLMQRAAYV